MPAHHRVRRDEPQVLAPASAEPASQDPHQLVPEAQASTRPGSGGTGQYGELVAQQQVLEQEVVAWANPRKSGREEQPEAFEHILSIADPPSREVVPPHRVSRLPSAFSSTVGSPASMMAATEFVVPRSIPNTFGMLWNLPCRSGTRPARLPAEAGRPPELRPHTCSSLAREARVGAHPWFATALIAPRATDARRTRVGTPSESATAECRGPAAPIRGIHAPRLGSPVTVCLRHGQEKRGPPPRSWGGPRSPRVRPTSPISSPCRGCPARPAPSPSRATR